MEELYNKVLNELDKKYGIPKFEITEEMQKSINKDDIPLIKVVSPEPKVVEKVIKQKVVSKSSSSQVKMLRAVVIVLLVVVVGMFAITLTSSNPTILDYETKLQNRYAAWEQDLTEREAAVAQREAALNEE